MACRLSMQQMAEQPQLARVYLPSALTSMKHYQTSKKNVTSLGQERDCLGQEARAAEALYTITGAQDQKLPVLMQPVQASGIITPAVPWIQPQVQRLENAGTRLKDQALAQNLIIFRERERRREMREQSGSAEVTALADRIRGTTQQAPTPTADLQQLNANMDIMERRATASLTGGTGAPQAGSSGLANQDANEA